MIERENMMKRLLCTLLGAAALLVPAAANAQFDDLEGVSHKDAVMLLHEQGAVPATSNTYKPNGYITRADAAYILANVLDLDLTAVKTSKFTDVNKEHLSSRHIHALAKAGIISGYKDGTFRPEATLTRGQMAKMLVEGFKLKTTSKNNPFTDAKNTGYNDYITALYDQKITTGKSATYYGVNDKLTRGQMATFAVRADNTPKKEEIDLSLLLTGYMYSAVPWMPQLATVVKKERAKDPNLLVVDTGNAVSPFAIDHYQEASYYRELFDGQVEAELMNYIGYDFVGFDEHDLDRRSHAQWEYPEFEQRVAQATFPSLFSNLRIENATVFKERYQNIITSTPKPGQIYSGIIKEIDGEKVGIFSLTGSYLNWSIHNKDQPDDFEVAQTMVKRFENLGVQKIVAISNHFNKIPEHMLGTELEEEFPDAMVQSIVETVPGIDVVLTDTPIEYGVSPGHPEGVLQSLDTYINKATKKPTYAVHSGSHLYYATHTQVTFNRAGDVTNIDVDVKEIDDYARDTGAQKIVDRYDAKVQSMPAGTIGQHVTKDVLDLVGRTGFYELGKPNVKVENNTVTLPSGSQFEIRTAYEEAVPGFTAALQKYMRASNHRTGGSAEIIIDPELSKYAAARVNQYDQAIRKHGVEKLGQITSSHLFGYAPDIRTQLKFYNTKHSMGTEILYTGPGPSEQGATMLGMNTPEYWDLYVDSVAQRTIDAFDGSPGHRIQYWGLTRAGELESNIRYGISYGYVADRYHIVSIIIGYGGTKMDGM